MNQGGFLEGFQEVPYFLKNFSSVDEINSFIEENVKISVDKLGSVNTEAIESDTFGDLALAKTIAELQDAYQTIPYGGEILS